MHDEDGQNYDGNGGDDGDGSDGDDDYCDNVDNSGIDTILWPNSRQER